MLTTLCLIWLAAIGFSAYQKYAQKERFIADPARGRAEMEYEQAQTAAKQQQWLGVGGGVLKWLMK